MAQVAVKINGFAYTVGCEDGQEEHLQAMATQVDTRIDSIKALGGNSGEVRLLLLASLLMADEIHDLRIEMDALREAAGRRFLVYGWFSSATPSAMARVFQAYGCSAAMHLDMNALEHTYLALYRARGGKLDVEHLVREMSVLDKTSEGTTVPRFLGFADNRDFFYVMRKRVPTQRSSMPARQASDPPALARLR